MLKIHNSARKHFINDEKLTYAMEHVLVSNPLDDEDDPRRWLSIAADPDGRLLELVILVFDSGDEILIHAMKARPHYLTGLL